MGKLRPSKEKRVNFGFQVGQKVAYVTLDDEPKVIMRGKISKILKHSFSIEWSTSMDSVFNVDGWALKHFDGCLRLIENGLEKAIRKAKNQ